MSRISLKKYRVSIHALLAECDPSSLAALMFPDGFNPRTPCGVRRDTFASDVTAASFNPRTPCGVRLREASRGIPLTRFQSTHSLRSATARKIQATPGPWSFNPRTPCGVRHTGREPGPLSEKFQSTHSLRSATDFTGFGRADPPVSIHALLAECDPALLSLQWGLSCFNPRTPCGVRLVRRVVPPHR